MLGFERVTDLPTDDFDATVLQHGGFLLKLMQHRTPADGHFDERRSGLDHLAFAVPNPVDVVTWAERLDACAVPHSGVKDGSLPGSRLIVFRDPDGVQLELYSS